MPANAYDSVRDKVQTIFKELAGDRAKQLDGSVWACSVNTIIGDALAADYDSKVAHEIAFHLVDWNSDAAFLIAVLLFPERFTQEEIQAGVTGFLIHAPHHIVAAARLGGHPSDDIFKDSAGDQF